MLKLVKKQCLLYVVTYPLRAVDRKHYSNFLMLVGRISLTFLACFQISKIFIHSFIVDFLKVHKNQDIYHFDIYKNGFFSLHILGRQFYRVFHMETHKSKQALRLCFWCRYTFPFEFMLEKYVVYILDVVF